VIIEVSSNGRGVKKSAASLAVKPAEGILRIVVSVETK
jgi:hypothetical protein